DQQTVQQNAIISLTAILRPFAEATELLGGSKYFTISFMYGVITVIEQGLLSLARTSNTDFDSSDNIFEDDIIYVDESQENYESYEKCRRININNLQNYENLKEKINKEAMLAMLLDLRCKPLSFMSESLKNETFELLKTKYKKSQVLYGVEENNNLQNHSNFLLASMFHNRCPRLEVSDYLGVQEILWNQCSLTWWRNNQARFSVLSKLARKYLAIPATSTASERLFSDAGNTMTKTSLLPTTFEHLV
ncbi:15845_t:CDS:2, partial [Racocetra persica]